MADRDVEQLALFLNGRDTAESGTASWEKLPIDARESYLKDATAILGAVQMLGWAPTTPPVDDGGEGWTDARIREAFIYDGGEAEYHDPINGAREQRRTAGAIFDAWLAAHDAAIADGLTASPTDDEREAITDKALWDFADGLLDAWNIEDENPPGLSEMFRDRFVARFRRQGPITDAMVEAAATETMRRVTGSRWVTLSEPGTPHGDYYRDQARAALEAARAVS